MEGNATKPATPVHNSVSSRAAVGKVCPDSNCLKPLLSCSACGVTNRSTARFCRNCRHELAFVEAEQAALEEISISQESLARGARQIGLSRLQGRAITALASDWGFLVFAAEHWGLGVMANTVLNPPRLRRQFESEETGEVTHFHAIQHHQLKPGFVGVGSKTVFRIDLLPGLSGKNLFRLADPAWEIESSVIADTHVVARLFHRKTRWYRWLAIDLETEDVKPLATQYRGAASAMIPLWGENQVLFATASELVKLNVRENSQERLPGPACGLETMVRPQQHHASGDIFMQGRDGALYRVNLQEIPIAIGRFGRHTHELMHIFISTYDDNLYLLGRDNVWLIDYPAGEESWSLNEHARLSLDCGIQTPRQLGGYILMTSLSPTVTAQGERVLLLPMAGRGLPQLLHPAMAASPMPVYGASGLIAARRALSMENEDKSALLVFQF